MRVPIDYGRQHAYLEVPGPALLSTTTAAPVISLADPAAAVRESLENPLDFPPLRQALTPDDQVAVLVDDHLPHLGTLLVPLLQHLLSAGVAPAAITLLCPPSSRQDWLDELPEELEEVRCEVHDPRDRTRLSFVANTSRNRPLFFNRTAVDAAQLVVLTGRRYDPLAGHGGGAASLFPTFSDQASRAEASKHLSLDAPCDAPSAEETEAIETAWLLGAPFFVQVIEGHADAIASVVAGPASSLEEGRRRQDAMWKRALPREADTVIATLSGDPLRHGLDELADALTCAVRVVREGGRIVLLCESAPRGGAAVELLRGASEPEEVLSEYSRRKDIDLRAAWQWAGAARHASLFLLSGVSGEMVEEMFATPVENLDQVQHLVNASTACVVLNDAHKTLAVIESGEQGA